MSEAGVWSQPSPTPMATSSGSFRIDRRHTMTQTKSPRATTFTAEERAAMKERNRELRSARSGKADGERDLLAKVAEMQGSDRAMAERIHAIVKATAPELAPRTWYGMPAYAKDDKVVCFFKPEEKFKARYATLGFR